MSTWVALLRGINVGGHNSVSMAGLRGLLEEAGYGQVRSYVQSGNLLFEAPGEAEMHVETIRGVIHRAFGCEVEVMVLSAARLIDIAASNPLLGVSGIDPAFCHATLFAKPVSLPAFSALALPAQPGERAVAVGRVVYVYCPHGYGRTKLNNAYFEKALGAPATTRNWKTISALRELCGA